MWIHPNISNKTDITYVFVHYSPVNKKHDVNAKKAVNIKDFIFALLTNISTLLGLLTGNNLEMSFCGAAVQWCWLHYRLIWPAGTR